MENIILFNYNIKPIEIDWKDEGVSRIFNKGFHSSTPYQGGCSSHVGSYIGWSERNVECQWHGLIWQVFLGQFRGTLYKEGQNV